MALQGPKAAEALSQHLPKGADLSKLPFLYSANLEVAGVNCIVSRCGYTGEDGFEVRCWAVGCTVQCRVTNLRSLLLVGLDRSLVRGSHFGSRFPFASAVAVLACLIESPTDQISIPKSETTRIFNTLLSTPNVLPAALGVRDSLRLESGMCLYGHDLNETITPIEASLNWLITKRRREAGGFPGHDVIQKQLKEGVSRSVHRLRHESRSRIAAWN